MTKVCRKCGVPLSIGENWTEGRKKAHDYLCKKCRGILARERRHREPEKTRAIYNRYAKKHPDKIHEKSVRRWKVIKKELVELRKEFGNKCYFCDSKRFLRFHDKKERPNHPKTPTWIRKYKDDIVLLDERCHQAVHFCMRFLGMEWPEIIQKFKEQKLTWGFIPPSLDIKGVPKEKRKMWRAILRGPPKMK